VPDLDPEPLLSSIPACVGSSRSICTQELPPSIPTPAGQKKISLKPSVPLDFDGDRSAGKAFLTSCRTYIRLQSEAFNDDLVKIIWAMSYMNAGRAGHWMAHEFETEAHNGRLCFLDWLDFEEEFQKDFFPLGAEAAAVNALEMTEYFQGNRTVEAYLDQFRDLVCDAEYSDLKTIVVKFRRGLNRRILMALAGMPIGRPSDRDPEAWFCLAVQMDQNQAADDAFHSQVPSTAFAAVPPCEPSTLLMGADTVRGTPLPHSVLPLIPLLPMCLPLPTRLLRYISSPTAYLISRSMTHLLRHNSSPAHPASGLALYRRPPTSHDIMRHTVTSRSPRGTSHLPLALRSRPGCPATSRGSHFHCSRPIPGISHDFPGSRSESCSPL